LYSSFTPEKGLGIPLIFIGKSLILELCNTRKKIERSTIVSLKCQKDHKNQCRCTNKNRYERNNDLRSVIYFSRYLNDDTNEVSKESPQIASTYTTSSSV